MRRCRSSIALAASVSVSSAEVTLRSTHRPWRFSMSAWPPKLSFDSFPLLLRMSLASGSVAEDSDGWLPVVIGKPDWMSTITLYGTEDGWEALKKKNLSLDEHKALAAGLAGTVQKIHALRLEQRRKQIASGTLPDVVRREPIRNPNKVGRNEPCPCGSGKKFKQCHGSADRLH